MSAWMPWTGHWVQIGKFIYAITIYNRISRPCKKAHWNKFRSNWSCQVIEYTEHRSERSKKMWLCKSILKWKVLLLYFYTQVTLVVVVVWHFLMVNVACSVAVLIAAICNASTIALNIFMFVCMYVCMYECMNVCMCVCDIILNATHYFCFDFSALLGDMLVVFLACSWPSSLDLAWSQRGVLRLRNNAAFDPFRYCLPFFFLPFFVSFALLWKFFTFNASLIAQQSHRAVKNGSSYSNTIINNNNNNKNDNNSIKVSEIVAKLCKCGKLKAFIGATRRCRSGRGHGPVVAVCQPCNNNNNNNEMLSMWLKKE